MAALASDVGQGRAGRIGMEFRRNEAITWDEVDRLIDHLIPQLEGEFTAMVMITRGGVVPGGLLAEALGLTHILTAAVDFPAKRTMKKRDSLFVWPAFLQFPEDDLLYGRRTLVVDDVWGSGRTITAVKNRVSAAGGFPFTCVLHFNPYRNLFGTARPDYYAAITDAFIIYPWEIDRGPDRVLLDDS
jgi:hypoxanthine phosphoribosyltransferase